jgi:hypothetical protein
MVKNLISACEFRFREKATNNFEGFFTIRQALLLQSSGIFLNVEVIR